MKYLLNPNGLLICFTPPTSDLQAQGSFPVAPEAVRGVEGGVQEVPRHDRQVGHELQAEGQDAARHQEADDRLQRRQGAQGRIGVVQCSNDSVKKTGRRLRERAYVNKGSQDAGSRNQGAAFFTIPFH